MRRSRTWRRAARKLAGVAHLYVGLAAGLVLVVVGVTGSVLVFRDEIDALLDPELLRVEPSGEHAPLDDVLAAARAAEPGGTPAYVRLPRSTTESAEIWLDDEDGPRVYVDPYRAVVLGSRLPHETFTGMLFELHVDLFAGEWGERVVGVSALLLLLLLVSGLVLWWPRPGRWRAGLKVRRGGTWRRTNYELHQASGAWTGVGLFVLALTGASLVFHDAFREGIHRLTASEPPPPPPSSLARPGAPDVEAALALRRAEAALPGGRFTWVYLPTSPEAPLALRKRLPGELHPNGRSYIYLDRHTGEVLLAHDATKAQLGTRIYDVLYPLHIGRFGGWSKVLYALLGFAPLLLFVGGTVIWWDRRARRAARKEAHVGPAAQADGSRGSRRARASRRARPAALAAGVGAEAD